MAHRGQAPWHVLPSAMQREQPISLVRSLSASIEHRVCGRLSWWSSSTGLGESSRPATRRGTCHPAILNVTHKSPKWLLLQVHPEINTLITHSKLKLPQHASTKRGTYAQQACD